MSSETFVRNANFPVDEAGRVHHVGVKPGDVANRIITVGDSTRAWKLASCLQEKKEDLKVVTSGRGFTTITGHYNDVLVTIISIGMGPAMMDFFVREVRAVVDGPIFICRFGSCGSLVDGASVGSLALASEAAGCIRNYDHFTGDKTSEPYIFTKPIPGDKAFEDLLKSLASSEEKLFTGLNVTCDSFYSSQGRIASHFKDDNEGHIDNIKKHYPNLLSLEMESYQLYHLAQCSLDKSIRAYALHMIFADRVNDVFLEDDVKDIVEPRAGKLVLDAVSKIQL
ncbi:purine and uridine phosphorylase [Neoconidiobolus thromboides FSU 785]|nr:purine and uridine phosphorylase [Neoconidiobolus thromboides FSU 785]